MTSVLFCVTCFTNSNPNRNVLPKQCERWTRRWTSPLTRTAWTPTVKPFTITTSTWVLTEWPPPSTTWKPVSAFASPSYLLFLLISFFRFYSCNLFFLFCRPGVYLDGRCVEHQRPMLEGGTQGSRGHTLVVVPHLTESYEKGTPSSDGAIPLCTLKNFPHRIEHTLQVNLLHHWLSPSL